MECQFSRDSAKPQMPENPELGYSHLACLKAGLHLPDRGTMPGAEKRATQGQSWIENTDTQAFQTGYAMTLAANVKTHSTNTLMLLHFVLSFPKPYDTPHILRQPHQQFFLLDMFTERYN